MKLNLYLPRSKHKNTKDILMNERERERKREKETQREREKEWVRETNNR